jgi:hypothetical protein
MDEMKVTEHTVESKAEGRMEQTVMAGRCRNFFKLKVKRWRQNAKC